MSVPIVSDSLTDQKASQNGHNKSEDEMVLIILASLGGDNPQEVYDLSQTGKYARQLSLLIKARANGPKAFEGMLSSIRASTESEIAILLRTKEAKDKAQKASVEVTKSEDLYPPLPQNLVIAPAQTQGLCPLKDTYIAFSKIKSPEGFEEFHSSCFWSMLSTIAGRRVAINLEGKLYTPLTVMLAARSTLYAKTATAEVVRIVLKQVGLDWLLGATRTTPQKLLRDMYCPIPEFYAEKSQDEQDLFKIRAAMSAQRGWHYNEFGKLIKSMVQINGPMSEFVSVLLQISDCPDDLPVGTVGRGDENIIKPYLSILGTLTPASIKAVAGRHSELWGDGFMARIMWSCPPPRTHLDAPFQRGSTAVPSHLVTSLRAWHNRLGIPVLEVEPITNAKGVETGRFKKEWQRDLPEILYSIDDAAYDGWVKYRSALKSMLTQLTNEDLDASYGRLPGMALSVAALAASLENATQIEQRHWFLGQEQAESWRSSLHCLYAQVNTSEPNSEPTLEEKVLEYVKKLQIKQDPSARDIARAMHLDTIKIEPILLSLVKNGVLEKLQGRQSPRYRIMEEE